MTWTKLYAYDRMPFEPLYKDIYNYYKLSPTEHVRNLSSYLSIADHLAPKDNDVLNRPVTRHPDLQPSNTMVSDSLEITGLIDWQHCSVLPLFLQAGPPKSFQNYGDEQSESLIEPRLPEDFQQLSAAEQDSAYELHMRRHLHYHYIAATAQLNPDHFEACKQDFGVLRQKLYQHAGTPWEGDNVTLKADLIKAMQHWPALTATKDSSGAPACPLSYSLSEIQECLKLDAEQSAADEAMEKGRQYLGIGVDGWAPSELYDNAKELSEKMKIDTLQAAESDEVRAKIEMYWPYDDHDEEE